MRPYINIIKLELGVVFLTLPPEMVKDLNKLCMDPQLWRKFLLLLLVETLYRENRISAHEFKGTHTLRAWYGKNKSNGGLLGPYNLQIPSGTKAAMMDDIRQQNIVFNILSRERDRKDKSS